MRQAAAPPGGNTVGVSRIDARPCDVRIERVAKGRFEDLRDAIPRPGSPSRWRPRSWGAWRSYDRIARVRQISNASDEVFCGT